MLILLSCYFTCFSWCLFVVLSLLQRLSIFSILFSYSIFKFLTHNRCNRLWWPAMMPQPIYEMDTMGTCHGYGRGANFTHKKWRIGYNMAWFFAYSEVSVYHIFWVFSSYWVRHLDCSKMLKAVANNESFPQNWICISLIQSCVYKVHRWERHLKR